MLTQQDVNADALEANGQLDYAGLDSQMLAVKEKATEVLTEPGDQNVIKPCDAQMSDQARQEAVRIRRRRSTRRHLRKRLAQRMLWRLIFVG